MRCEGDLREGEEVAALTSNGCSGIVAEMMREDGSTERLRIQSSEKWRDYDRNPLKQDGASIMLKKESTF
jgi:hypothetical protein